VTNRIAYLTEPPGFTQGIGFACPRLLTLKEQFPKSELLALVNVYRHDGASILVELKSWNRGEVDVAIIFVKLPQSFKPLACGGVVERLVYGDIERVV
jgi:hypothetical protein